MMQTCNENAYIKFEWKQKISDAYEGTSYDQNFMLNFYVFLKFILPLLCNNFPSTFQISFTRTGTGPN